ncbi:MAG: LamG domain-containing protein [Bacteroidales bacterium]|nr:LamG domain-containing protein [Bacteroidales bacterium]
MKTKLFKNAFIACLSLAMCASAFISCDKDETFTPADTTKLAALIDSCQTLSDEATTTDYPQAAITAFDAVLATAKTAILNTKISQTAVDNLVVQLRAARATFLAAAFDAISPSALLMGLSFDEGTGSQLTAAGKGWTAVLTAGPSQIFGTGTSLPSFVTGKVGKAMSFSNGSHLEINNYTASDLLSNTLSIAVWVYPDSTRENNYLLSYNYWNTWKFQLQLQNKPFFTAKTSAGFTDADDQLDFSAPNGAWTHLVLSMNLTTGKLVFYVNGQNQMEWTSVTKPNFTGSFSTYATVLPLMVGAGFTYAEGMAVMGTESWWQTKQAFPHYAGLMDELKLYNIALTDGQAAKLYNDEK